VERRCAYCEVKMGQNCLLLKGVNEILPPLFFCEETRSRCYGRTAALRLNVQPCDDEN
jgi:hypothetical protein